jgi:glutamate N-acetyltransferase/amino-acid N-acetyltransferase
MNHAPNATDVLFLPAPGFRAAATACGLKASGAPDLALILADREAAAAGTFTTNRVQAAPVLWDRQVLARSADRVRAVVANSGCANACTGEPGLADTRSTATLAARAIGCAPEQVLVLSTGVIGRRLDMERMARGIATLGAPGAGGDAARAIMTTDTRPKLASSACTIGGREVRIEGIAKGAGMIHPNMATMLSVLTTDLKAAAAELQPVLEAAVRRSFNRISVDGDMSTNDTVLLLASGASGATLGAMRSRPSARRSSRRASRSRGRSRAMARAPPG